MTLEDTADILNNSKDAHEINLKDKLMMNICFENNIS